MVLGVTCGRSKELNASQHADALSGWRSTSPAREGIWAGITGGTSVAPAGLAEFPSVT